MITTHGDDTYRYDGIETNFSSNISAMADLSGLKAHLAVKLHTIGSYPEPEAWTLERMIAEREGVDASCVVVTNGATEAIYLLAQIFKGERSTIAEPTFSEYRAACRAFGHTIDGDGHVRWLCNPNNPTGTVVKEGNFASDAFHIVDHAYEDYTTMPLMGDGEAVERGNMAIIHSMTKRYGVPGLRLGYIVTNASTAERIRQVKQPWSVNSLAIAAGEYLVANGQRPNAKAMLAEAQRLAAMLNSVEGISVAPTQTNFMLATIAHGTAAQLKDYLATQHHILIRDASDFVGLSQRHFRIAAQSHEKNVGLVEAIRQYINNV